MIWNFLGNFFILYPLPVQGKQTNKQKTHNYTLENTGNEIMLQSGAWLPAKSYIYSKNCFHFYWNSGFFSLAPLLWYSCHATHFLIE